MNHRLTRQSPVNSGGAPQLAELQALLYRLLTAPQGVAAGLEAEGRAVDLEQVVIADERLNAIERLDIYAGAYFHRLLDSLTDDFPAVLAMIGEDQFHNLITGYLLMYPPAEPSLLQAGQYLADYIERIGEFVRWPFLADLARLERALIESFHAADAASLDPAAMRAIPPSDWPAVHLRLHPAVRLVKARWRLDEVVRAVADNALPIAPVEEAASLVVWRRRSEVFYRVAEPIEAIALDLIKARADFASICAAIANAAGDDGAADLISRFLARWLSEGLLIGQTEGEI